MSISQSELDSYKDGLEKRLTIDGENKNYPSKRIPLDKLFYNDLNGRIATYIEEYNQNNPSENIKNLLTTSVEKYNEIIANFIKESADDNFKSFNKTKEDIRQNLQKEVGVVLSDGRIIDGNRRFTALRELYKETGDPKYGYFEAVCLPAPADDNKEGWKKIKLLELNLQFNVDEKRQYNRIDFLVSFWRDAINPETKICEEKQYCYSSGMNGSQFKKNKNIVNLMLDYLNWRGQPFSFYILKNEKLDGPIEDIVSKKNRIDSKLWEEKKAVIYSYITLNDCGDRTRDVRKLLDSLIKGTSLFEEVEKTLESPENSIKIAKSVELMNKKGQKSTEDFSKLQTYKSNINNQLDNAIKEGSLNDVYEKSINEPKEALSKALEKLKTIDITFVKNMNQTNKDEINNAIEELQEVVEKIKNATM